jgi:hypothetical protein
MTGLGLFAARVGFSALFGAAGLWALSMTRAVLAARRRWARDGIVADGTVVAFATRKSTSHPGYRDLYAPVVKFTTRDGAPIRFTSSRAERPNPYVVGQAVRVRYLARDPKGADLDSVTSSWFIPFALAVMAVACLLVASLPWLLGPPSPR